MKISFLNPELCFYFIALFICLSVQDSKAQSFLDENPDIEKIFFKKLNRYGIKYQPSKNYEEIFDIRGGTIGPRLLSLSMLKLKSKKDSVLIYVAFLGIDTTARNRALNKRLNLRDENVEYLANGADSLNHPLTILSPKLAKRYYNADAMVTRGQEMFKKRYLDAYTRCQLLVIHKENVADILLYFFHTDGSKKRLKHHIKNSRQILSFKD